jgi:hypothetical protein
LRLQTRHGGGESVEQTHGSLHPDAEIGQVQCDKRSRISETDHASSMPTFFFADFNALKARRHRRSVSAAEKSAYARQKSPGRMPR